MFAKHELEIEANIMYCDSWFNLATKNMAAVNTQCPTLSQYFRWLFGLHASALQLQLKQLDLTLSFNLTLSLDLDLDF